MGLFVLNAGFVVWWTVEGIIPSSLYWVGSEVIKWQWWVVSVSAVSALCWWAGYKRIFES